MGVGGIGVSALARYAKDNGAFVAGCDANDSPVLKALETEGIRILTEKNVLVSDYEGIIRSNAVPKEHVILQEALRLGIPVWRRGDVLADILSNTSSIAVTGSHGKTTITSLIAHLLKSAGKDPTLYGGGIDLASKTNYIGGKGKWFVAEMDESDRTFVAARPLISVISNLELEHVDQYPTFNLLKEAFAQYLSQSREGAFWIMNGDDPVLVELKQHFSHSENIVVCGQKVQHSYRLLYVEQRPEGIKIEISTPKGNMVIQSRLLGLHNAYNMLMAAAAAHLAGLTNDQICDGFRKYPGVKRRFELLKILSGGTELISDYGHHPTEIGAVLKAVKSEKNHKIIAVFEAHRCSRFKALMNEFALVFKGVDKLIVTDIHTAGEPDETESLVQELISKTGEVPSLYVPYREVYDYILKEFGQGEKVILFTAGKLDSVVRERI